MAKRGRNFGEEAPEEDKKKITGESLRRTLRLFRFVRPYRTQFVLMCVFLGLSTASTLVFPALIGQVTKVIEGKSAFTLAEVIGLFGGVLILQAVFSFFRIYFSAQVSERSMADVRRAVYSKIVSLPIPFMEKRRVGELTSRLSADVSQLQDVLSITLAEFFRQIATLLGGTAFILYVSWKLTLFMLGTFPVIIVAAMLFGRFIRKLSKEAQDQLAAASVIVEETLQSINVVKAFTNERFEISRYSEALKKMVGTTLRTATYRGLFVSFVITAMFGAIMGIVWYGGTLVQRGEIEFADLLSFIFYTAFIGGSVAGMGDLYAQIQRTIGASERILDILEEQSEVDLDQPQPVLTAPITGDVAFNNVAFSYPSRPDVPVLRGVSLQVNSGKKIALVGQSGAGKSTIVQLLMRYYPFNDGQITVDGQSITGMNVTTLRQHIAVVPQEVMLFGGTIEENIRYGRPNASEDEVRDAARRANVLGFIESFPEGMTTIVGERGVKLSGGQRQRIAIARAILKDPAILILDEATSSLDAESERLVQEALDELMQNRTTIIVAHRLATIRHVDQIYVLRDGLIAEQGTHDELASLPNGLYASLVKLQFDNVNSH
jgi:ATP-binding cassette, subfamily B, bacterial